MEDLKWDFEYESQIGRLDFSNGNKNVKNVSGSYATIKLKNNTIKKAREYNITLQSEIKNHDLLRIGVCDGEWGKKFVITIYLETLKTSLSK